MYIIIHARNSLTWACNDPWIFLSGVQRESFELGLEDNEGIVMGCHMSTDCQSYVPWRTGPHHVGIVSTHTWSRQNPPGGKACPLSTWTLTVTSEFPITTVPYLRTSQVCKGWHGQICWEHAYYWEISRQCMDRVFMKFMAQLDRYPATIPALARGALSPKAVQLFFDHGTCPSWTVCCWKSLLSARNSLVN